MLPMNIDESALAEHPVIQALTRRLEALEAQLNQDHQKLEKLEHELEHDHAVIGKLEQKPAYTPPPPKPTRMTVGL